MNNSHFYAARTDALRRLADSFYQDALDNAADWWKRFSEEHRLCGTVRMRNMQNIPEAVKRSGNLSFHEGKLDYLHTHKDGRSSWVALWDFGSWLRLGNPDYPTLESVGEYLLTVIEPLM